MADSAEVPTNAHARLEAARKAFAERLAEVDRLVGFPAPLERRPELGEIVSRLNATWRLEPPASGGGLAAPLRRHAVEVLRPTAEQQTAFNASVVQVINVVVEELACIAAHLREAQGAVVRHLQKVEPLVDAYERAGPALVVEHTELLIEASDRRQESLSRRVDGLSALRDRVDVLTREVGALRAVLEAGVPPPAVAAAAVDATEGATYSAFEDRFRGSREDTRDHLLPYVDVLRPQTPVVDLGCGRGELLEALREAGVEARGVEANVQSVVECRERGLDVVLGDLMSFLRQEKEAAAGAVVAIHVVEHLQPRVLLEFLAEARRVLRPGGLLLLETPNPRSVLGLLEVFNRDLTHERPLHPETLRFLAAAAGFTDVRIEMKTAVDPSTLLRALPAEGLSAAVREVLDENVSRLNALLFGPLEYALLANR